MSRKLAALDRFLTLLIALALLALGAWLILIWADVAPAPELWARFDHDAVSRFPGNRWYTLALTATLILGVLLGLWLIIANLRARRFSRKASPASNREGTIDLNVDTIAGVIDRSLEKEPRVRKVRHTSSVDRSRPTVSWTVTADPNVDLVALRDTLELTERDFRDAVGDIDVDTRYRVHLEAVER